MIERIGEIRQVVKEADAILITSGAGIGVDIIYIKI